MAVTNLPQIGGDFVLLVETMRTAQTAYEKTRGSREMQEKKKYERLVDAMIGGWRREFDKLLAWRGELKTDELPGLYDVSKKG